MNSIERIDAYVQRRKDSIKPSIKIAERWKREITNAQWELYRSDLHQLRKQNLPKITVGDFFGLDEKELVWFIEKAYKKGDDYLGLDENVRSNYGRWTHEDTNGKQQGRLWRVYLPGAIEMKFKHFAYRETGRELYHRLRKAVHDSNKTKVNASVEAA